MTSDAQTKARSTRRNPFPFIFAGIAVGCTALYFFFKCAPEHADKHINLDAKAMSTDSGRFWLALRWCALPAFILIMQVQMVALYRLIMGKAPGTTDPTLSVFLCSLQNTLEQTVVLVLNVLILSQNLNKDQAIYIPLVVVNFTIARILFLIGYLIWPPFRAVGFAMTMIPNVALSGFNGYRLFQTVKF